MAERKYMVMVSGKSAPTKIHDNYNSAKAEAIRLARVEVGHIVSVVEIIRQYRAEITVEEYHHVEF